MRPNILLIVLDAARRDAFEPYGAPVGSSPNVAQMAERGRALDGVYAAGSWTVPSHASIFTGLMPRAASMCRVPSPAAAKTALEPLGDRMLASVMRRGGYRTRGLSANFWVSPVAGFDEGFDTFRVGHSDRGAELRGVGARQRAKRLAEIVRARADDGARDMSATLSRWTAERGDQPFFWFVNLLECHSPYLPPRPYTAGLSTRLRAAEDARRYYTLQTIWRVCAGSERVPPEVLERLRDMYTRSIRYMDDWLGLMFQRLDDAGVLDDTLVVVLSDHGENFGENGLIAHGGSLDERLIRVPFVAAGPGADALDLCSLADLPRSLAEATGVEHPWSDGPPGGFGLAQYDPPVTFDDAEGRAALEEMGITGDELDYFLTPLTCAVKDDLKLVRRGNEEQVFDLRSDPLEERPLAAEALPARAEALSGLRDALAHPSMGFADAAAPATAQPEASAEEIADLEARMRLLGYL